MSHDLSHNTANTSTSLPPSSFLNFLPHAASLFPAALFSRQEGALEAPVQPEDHGGGSGVNQQPKRVVTLRRPAAAPQGHEQHPEPRTKEWAGQDSGDLTDTPLPCVFIYLLSHLWTDYGSLSA